MKKIKSALILCTSLILVLTLTVCSFAAVIGDVDNNGKVEAADARLALRASVNLEKYVPGSAEFLAADVDFDNAVTAADARLILRASVNLEKLKEKETTPETPKEPVYTAWKPEVKSATSTVSTGRHFRTDTVSGKVEYAECSFGEWTQQSAASCTSAQILVHTCSVCGGKQTKAGTAALGHVQGTRDAAKSKAATCTDRGVEVYLCTRCGKNYTVYTKALGHDFSVKDSSDAYVKSAATCTAPAVSYYKCVRCTAKSTATYESAAALGHNYAVAGNVLGENVQTLCCTRCKLANNTVDAFNQLVNPLKAIIVRDQFTVDYFTRNDMFSTCPEDSIKFYSLGGIPDPITTAFVKSAFAEEMEGHDVSYSAIQTNKSPLRLPIGGKQVVSELENGDATVNASILSGLKLSDILTVFDDPDKIDIAKYKALTVSGDVLKVSVKIKDEKFLGANGIADYPEEKKTALQKLTGDDIRAELTAFEKVGDTYKYSMSDPDLESFTMEMLLKQITAGAKADYYFDAATLEPIAAVYHSEINMDQTISLKLLTYTGNMDPAVFTVTDTVYIFASYFD